jgi:hypothetical protein
MPMSFEEPAQLEFRRRPEQRPRRMQPFSSQSIWLVIAIIAAVVFVLFVRAMLERSAWTAGHSTVVVSEEPRVPSDAELNAQAWSQLPQPEETQPREAVADREVPGRALVYRCVGKRGAVSFQSQPCGAEESTTRVFDAAPEYERPRPITSSSSSTTMRQGYSYPSINTDPRDQRRANCESAKRNRDAILERVGLARTYDLLRRLDATVYEACKGL